MTWELLPDSEDEGRGRQPGSQQGNSGSGSGSPDGTWTITHGGPASSAPRSPRWVLTLVGGLVAALGIALLIWPFFAASRILAFLVGAAFIGNGIAALVGTRSRGARGISSAAGILFIVLGLIAIVLPDFTVTMLVSFVAITMLFIGGIWFLFAWRLRSQVGTLFVVLPAIVFGLGLAALIWPAFALTISALAAGVVTLVIGASLIWVSLAARRTHA